MKPAFDLKTVRAVLDSECRAPWMRRKQLEAFDALLRAAMRGSAEAQIEYLRRAGALKEQHKRAHANRTFH